MTKREQEMERLRKQIERADEAKTRLAKLELEEMKKKYPRLAKFRNAFANLISDEAIDLYSEEEILNCIKKNLTPQAVNSVPSAQSEISSVGRNYDVSEE